MRYGHYLFAISCFALALGIERRGSAQCYYGPGVVSFLGWAKETPSAASCPSGESFFIYAPGGINLGDNQSLTAIDDNGHVHAAGGCNGGTGDVTYGQYWDSSGTWTSASTPSSSFAYGAMYFQYTGTTRPWSWGNNGSSNGLWYYGTAWTEITGSSSITSFAVDPSSNVYATRGGSCTPSGLPHGTCIQKTANGGSTWAGLTGGPGAKDITYDGAASVLYALGSAHGVYKTSNETSWTLLGQTICPGYSGAGNTLYFDQIAASDGWLVGINDNSGNPGQVYAYAIGTTTNCWSPLGSQTFVSISATENAAVFGECGSWPYCGTVSGIGGDGNVYVMGCQSAF